MAPAPRLLQGLAGARIDHLPRAMHDERAIEASVVERMNGKSGDKFAGQTLLVVTPLSSAPAHNWSGMVQRLAMAAKRTAFGRIVLMDETAKAEPIVVIDHPSADDNDP